MIMFRSHRFAVHLVLCREGFILTEFLSSYAALLNPPKACFELPISINDTLNTAGIGRKGGAARDQRAANRDQRAANNDGPCHALL